LNLRKFFKKLFKDYLRIWESKDWWKNRLLAVLFGLGFGLLFAPLMVCVVQPWLEHNVIEKWGLKVSTRFLREVFIFIVGILIILLGVAIIGYIKNKRKRK